MQLVNYCIVQFGSANQLNHIGTWTTRTAIASFVDDLWSHEVCERYLYKMFKPFCAQFAARCNQIDGG